MKRVLLKLSGEALAGDKKTGFDEATCIGVANQVKQLVDRSGECFHLFCLALARRLLCAMRSLQVSEAGDIEQDASIIILLWNLDNEDKTRKGLKVDKNRQGELGKIVYRFDGNEM